MVKMSPRRLHHWLWLFVLMGVVAYALAEDLTLTTYYPSPRGVYKEVRTSGDVAIGTTAAPQARLQVVRATDATSLALLVEDAPNDPTPLVLDETGKLGLGTRDPKGPLTITGAMTDPVGGNCPAGYEWYNEDGDGTIDPQECRQTTLIIQATGRVGIGTGAPVASALLDLTSSTKAFLLPRMTEEQRDAITPRVDGLVIYNTDSDQIESCCDASGNWKSASGAPHGVQSFAASGPFTVPSGVQQVTVESWGGGGGGTGSVSGCSTVTIGGDGGGGGGYGKQVFTVTSGATYTVVVGAGGAGANGSSCPSCGCGFADGAQGGTSSFKVGATTLVSASGGGGGEGGGAPPAAPGGSSSAAISMNGGVGGFGSADDSSCQPAPIGGDGGYGGAGGNGGSATGAAHCLTNGIPGNAPGGGGSGASGRTGGRGGDGAPGRVVISW